MSCTILWFRRDLRLQDNPALHWACENSDRILPIYIHAPQEEQWAPGAASRWWLHHSLQQLEQALQEYDLALYRFSGDSGKLLAEISQISGATELVFNRLYEPHLAKRDEQLCHQLEQQGINIHSFHDGLFFQPGSILNKQDSPYRVYTPFYRNIRGRLEQSYSNYRPLNSHQQLQNLELETSLAKQADKTLSLCDEHPWHDKLHQYWQPGEQSGLEIMDRFIDQTLEDYIDTRDIPSLQGTSRLSPNLHFGELNVQQIYHMLQPLLAGSLGRRAMDAAERFLSQLIWREFAHHILWHYPHSSDKPMNSRFSNRFWCNNKKDFSRWTQGNTGVPLVDAGMKQLWETGWMHNRVRMVVASYLSKNLGISWLQGARWFWDTLVDADLANNSMGWQWVAGCGVDAAPYYRIFNPLTQARRFDSESTYIDRWLPEHNKQEVLDPMVDLTASREQALQRYKQHMNEQEL
ncbi:MAG: cryptochrome/photolyase family protein [Gammaproteobacteria bacterium]